MTLTACGTTDIRATYIGTESEPGLTGIVAERAMRGLRLSVAVVIPLVMFKMVIMLYLTPALRECSRLPRCDVAWILDFVTLSVLG